MLKPYREIFAAPGSLRFSLAGFVARMPQSMLPIGLVAMLSELRGQYGLAGAVSATFTLSMALLSPLVSRLVDRHGQRRILVPAMAVSAASITGVLLSAHFGAPAWTLFAFAVPAGTLPTMSAMVRARWTEIYRGSDAMTTTHSFESVVDELTYVTGPAVSILLSTAVFPQAGPLLAIVLLVAGVAAFAVQRRTEPAPRPAETGGGSAIRRAPLRLLVFVLFAGGVVVGTVDVVSVAFAEQQGITAAAGIVATCYALGSGIAGLAFGAWKPRIALPKQLVIGAAGTAATTLPFLLAADIASLSAAVFVAGAFFAPTMIIVMSLIEKLVPPAQLTEGLTWAATGVSIGMAAGAGASGFVVDAFGATTGFTVALCGGVLALAAATVGLRMLTRALRSRPGATERMPVTSAAG
ncbi:MFS transporter [Stackebrandtia nassauensis]|uniref:Major facilitator superfamily MFS_1 n=1 Tax=Stackebrandtia nassauensis (strain DSM 44728 / CIP 108903 / NRRL B-16338 / NBRC 102104 / LLR-40K-21) TaxID=446470 RepID=D3Q0U1_STANL|nr:MFS transporter [Stackebrandtia nassauensis]ADD43691.1 major facilitator superfamily MFS_1 [Stackebrandtia nassauensis DSM 44728]